MKSTFHILKLLGLSKRLAFMETAAYPMHIDLFVTRDEKTGLIYTKIPIHITVCISLTV